MTKARIKPTQFFQAHPIFTFDEFVSSEPDRPIGTVKALLRYHCTRGNLVRVRRGLYLRQDWFDPFLLASRLAGDAVIAYDSALLLQQSSPPSIDDVEQVTFLTASPRVRLKNQTGIHFRAVLPPPILGKGWAKSGVGTLERSGLTLAVTTPERTVVDLLDRIALAPAPTELWELLVFSELDFDAMVRHARALESRVLAARLGFLLEYLPAVPHKQLEALERIRPSSPVYFDRPRQSGQSRFIKRWNLVVSSRLAQSVLRTDFSGRTPSLPKETELPP